MVALFTGTLIISFRAYEMEGLHKTLHKAIFLINSDRLGLRVYH